MRDKKYKKVKLKPYDSTLRNKLGDYPFHLPTYIVVPYSND